MVRGWKLWGKDIGSYESGHDVSILLTLLPLNPNPIQEGLRTSLQGLVWQWEGAA